MIKKKLVFMSSLSKIIYISRNHVNFLSFDNDDKKPSKRQVTFLSLISGLNHNINKQKGEDGSGPSVILLNYL